MPLSFVFSRRIIWFTLSFFCSIHLSSAQITVGTGGGLSFNKLNTNITTQSYSKENWKTGYSFNVFCRIPIRQQWALQADLNYLQKNNLITRNGPYEGIYTLQQSNYLQMPVIAFFTVKNKSVTYYLGGGAYVAYWLNSQIEGKIPDLLSAKIEYLPDGQTTETFDLVYYTSKYEFQSGRDNRIEWGWLCSTMIHYTLNKTYGVYFDARYYQAITNQRKNLFTDQSEGINQSITMSIGVSIQLKAKAL